MSFFLILPLFIFRIYFENLNVDKINGPDQLSKIHGYHSGQQIAFVR